MSKPAKDEAELLEQVVLTTCECQPGECYVKMGQMLCCAEDDKVEAVFAAIRKAGWAVVPQTELDALRAKNAQMRDDLVYISDVCVRHDQGNETGRVLGHIADNARAALEVKP